MPDLVEIGTASNYSDLLDKLVTFATGTTWWTTLQNDSEMTCLQGEGSGAEEIIVAFKKYSDVPSDSFGWFINGFTGYTNGLTFTQQPGALQNWNGSNAAYPAIPLWNSSIPYWFIVNSRRIIVVAKVSTTFQMCYAGFFLPFASPGQYPYPMMIGGTATRGSTTGTPRFSLATDQAQAFWRGADGQSSGQTLAIRTPSGVWELTTNNIGNSGSSGGGLTNINCDGIWPFSSSPLTPAQFQQAIDDTPVLTPLMWHKDSQTAGFRGFVGEFDGVYHVSGVGRASEDVISIDGDDYLVVQNVFRTAVNDYCAVHIGETESSSS